MADPITLDFSKAQSVGSPAPAPAPATAPPQQGVSLDFSNAQPLSAQQPPQASAPTPDSDSGGGLLSTIGNYEKGLAKGVLGTTTGIGNIVHNVGEAIHPGLGEAIVPASGLRAEGMYADPHGTAQHVGSMAENVAEFMMGDEALKGLSMSQRLAETSKLMGLAEKYPTLMKALHIGATTTKAAAELSPEEVELVKAHPILSKLLGTSLSAVRAGAVQGAQTTVKTGGNLAQGAKDAIGTAATAGAIGGVTGGAAHILGKGAKAANTVARMGELAESAPTRAGVEDQLSNAVHDSFQNETGQLQNNLNDATSTVGMFGEGAPGQSSITTAAKKYAAAGKQAVHNAYQQGFDKLVDMAGDRTIPYENSPLHNAAKSLAAEGTANAGPLDDALSVDRPGSPKANRVIDNLAKFSDPQAEALPEAERDRWNPYESGMPDGAPTAGGEGEEPVPTSVGMNHLVEYRQKLARISRDLNPTSPDYRADKQVYQKLISGVDDTIGQLADSVGGSKMDVKIPDYNEVLAQRMTPRDLMAPEIRSDEDFLTQARIPLPPTKKGVRDLVAQIVRDRYDDMAKSVEALPDQVPVYRSLRVPNGIEDVKLDNLGRYWSQQEEGAQPYHGPSKGKVILLRGTANKEDMDPMRTLMARMRSATGYDEAEVNLKPSSTPRNLSYKLEGDADWKPFNTEEEPMVPDAAQGQDSPSIGRQHFDAMNEAYRNGIQPFQNRDVQNILKGNLNDVTKSLMGGQTSLDDIKAVKSALGPQNFAQIGRASLQNIVSGFVDGDTGEVDYKKLFQKFNRINPDVRAAMFGNDGAALSDALKVATQSASGMGEIGKKITGLLGNGDIDTILKSPQQAKQLSDAIGPDGMKTLGRSILQNKIAEASTTLDPKTGQIVKTNFDPDKVLDWWMSMKNNPEVRDSIFTVDKDTAKQYDEMMSNLAQASSVKKLVKYGVLPITLGTAGLVHSPLGALTGALAGLGAETGFGRARDILDSVANNPHIWDLLRSAGNAAETVDSKVKPLAGVIGAKTYTGVTNSASQ